MSDIWSVVKLSHVGHLKFSEDFSLTLLVNMYLIYHIEYYTAIYDIMIYDIIINFHSLIIFIYIN